MSEIDKALKKLGMTEPPCPIYWTTKNLHFWELGAYFEQGHKRWIELNPKCPLKCLGYNHQKVLQHELIHAARADFKDSVWEELIAYQVATYSYQRFLGPFLASKISAILLLTLPLLFYVEVAIGFIALAILVLLFIKHLACYRHLRAILVSFRKEGLSETEAFNKLISYSEADIVGFKKKGCT